jgi:hypothetical protein
MVPRATTTTPDPELSMPLQPGRNADQPEENQAELPHAGDVSAEQPHAGPDSSQEGGTRRADRRGAKP